MFLFLLCGYRKFGIFKTCSYGGGAELNLGIITKKKQKFYLKRRKYCDSVFLKNEI